MALRQLENDQVKAFDVEYVDEDRWAVVKKQIDADFPDGEFSFLDIGGGNGQFADRVLSRYPKARGAVLDNSELLLSKNTPHPAKTVILKSAGELSQLSGEYDMVCCNWVLHHLVDSTYSSSRQQQFTALTQMKRLLSKRGRISIFENNYTGWITDNFPGRIIYSLTSSKPIAQLAKRLGANTAGVGVCFLSKDAWTETLGRAGLSIHAYAEPDKWKWPVKWYYKTSLGLRRIVAAHYWIRRS